MRGTPFVLFVVAAAVAGMVLQYGVGDMPVRYQLDRAVVVAQLLLGQYVRAVAVNLSVDTDDLLHDAGDRASSARCICPPETSPMGLRAVSAIPDAASSSIALARSSFV